jgi:hypothetical protein
VDKKLEYKNKVTSTNPEIIIETESWLKPKHFDNEIFHPDLGYTPYRRERKKQAGGGVFIAVKTALNHKKLPTSKLIVKIYGSK